jgi:hypothetical protein
MYLTCAMPYTIAVAVHDLWVLLRFCLLDSVSACNGSIYEMIMQESAVR